MIERWFPCAEVSEAAESGWGSGKSEKALFTWFAARPLAQLNSMVRQVIMTLYKRTPFTYRHRCRLNRRGNHPRAEAPNTELRPPSF